MDEEEEKREEIDPVSFGVTLPLFLEWRSPRFGDSNPTKIESRVWEWLVRSRLSGYWSTQKMQGPSASDEGPTWSFDRFGQSSTELPDGRVIRIAGEHEDFYDPDFCIYNDVVVFMPDDSLEFYCYPRDVFPSTDFHSATLVNDEIVIIGNLGYQEERVRDHTPVYILDTVNYKIRKSDATGTHPGWIHNHKAELSPDKKYITVKGGELYSAPGISLRENIDDWRLDLENWRWERLTERKWTRWEIRRRDRTFNLLWRIRSALVSRRYIPEEYEKEIEHITQELGITPDLELVDQLYSPGIPHERLPEVDDEYNVYRIRVNGVTVRFVEHSQCVQATVEGELPVEIIEMIQQHSLHKLSRLENKDYVLEIFQDFSGMA